MLLIQFMEVNATYIVVILENKGKFFLWWKLLEYEAFEIHIKLISYNSFKKQPLKYENILDLQNYCKLVQSSHICQTQFLLFLTPYIANGIFVTITKWTLLYYWILIFIQTSSVFS